jgi:hypothetical protein
MSVTRFPRQTAGMLLFVAALLTGLAAAHAHHGWRWTKDGKFEITGVVASAKLGNPHGVVKLSVEGKIWTIEVGQPWRNRRAGLTDAMFAKGREITIIGQRSADAKERRVKALRVRINGRNHDLYPDRL